MKRLNIQLARPARPGLLLWALSVVLGLAAVSAFGRLLILNGQLAAADHELADLQQRLAAGVEAQQAKPVPIPTPSWRIELDRRAQWPWPEALELIEDHPGDGISIQSVTVAGASIRVAFQSPSPHASVEWARRLTEGESRSERSCWRWTVTETSAQTAGVFTGTMHGECRGR